MVWILVQQQTCRSKLCKSVEVEILGMVDKGGREVHHSNSCRKLQGNGTLWRPLNLGVDNIT